MKAARLADNVQLHFSNKMLRLGQRARMEDCLGTPGMDSDVDATYSVESVIHPSHPHPGGSIAPVSV